MSYKKSAQEVKVYEQKMFRMGDLFLKKVLMLVGIVGLLVLPACGQMGEKEQEKPKEVVGNFLDYYVEGNIAGMRQYYGKSEEDFIPSDYVQLFENVDINLEQDSFSEFYENKLVLAVATKIKYNLGKEEKKDNKAVVSMVLETPDMFAIVKEMVEYPGIASLTQEELDKYIIDKIAEGEQIKIEVQIPLELIREVWVIDLDNAEVMDALSGGLLSVYQELYQEIWGEIKKMGEK